MASLANLVGTWRERWRALQLERAIKRRPDSKIGGVAHKVPPEHHNRGTGG